MDTLYECICKQDGPNAPNGSQDNLCYVYDPITTGNPTQAVPTCYHPLELVCTVTNFLCPPSAQYACGRACFDASQYSCHVDTSVWFNSVLTTSCGTTSSGQQVVQSTEA